MPDQPLQPFSPPTALLSNLHIRGIPWGTVMTWILYAIFAFWAVYTFIAIFHWLKYSHASWVAFPAIALHIVVSLALISYILNGSSYFLAPYLP